MSEMCQESIKKSKTEGDREKNGKEARQKQVK